MEKNTLIPLVNHQKLGNPVKILFEEDHFGRLSSRPFKVLCLERPLYDSSPIITPTSSSSSSPDSPQRLSPSLNMAIQTVSNLSGADKFTGLEFPSPMNPSAIRSFINGYEENIFVVRKMDRSIAELKETLKARTAPDVSKLAQEVKKIVDELTINLLIANPTFRILHDTNKSLHEFEQTVECYVLDSLHDTIFSLLRLSHTFPAEDNYYHKLREVARNISQTDLGIRTEFQHLYLEAIAQFDQLPKMTSPIAKLMCIGETIERVTTSLGEKYSQGSLDLTTDDVIPLLVYVLSHSQVPALRTTQEYLESFVFNGAARNQLSYYLATFEASIEFLRTPDFARLASVAGQQMPPPPIIISLSEISSKAREATAGNSNLNRPGSENLNDHHLLSRRSGPLAVSQNQIRPATEKGRRSAQLTATKSSSFSPSSPKFSPSSPTEVNPSTARARRDSLIKKNIARSLMGTEPTASSPPGPLMKGIARSNSNLQSL
eukprot:TRINITY_DN2235_c0_g1_i2.p1 TRINITY_DN2235_c0_g1~~TRINITY_DN2235_c0_g1_i2.p1  ORF type:complete len:573 (+),score=127.05 TRINITY_DN2235_c0_g1_i2:252-1721(+)